MEAEHVRRQWALISHLPPESATAAQIRAEQKRKPDNQKVFSVAGFAQWVKRHKK